MGELEKTGRSTSRKRSRQSSIRRLELARNMEQRGMKNPLPIWL